MPVTAQERLGAVLNELKALHAKGKLEGADVTTYTNLVTEGGELKAQIEQQSAAKSLMDWANESAGGISLATAGLAHDGNRTVVKGMDLSGGMEVGFSHEPYKIGQNQYRIRHGIEILDQYGEGLSGGKAIFSTQEYRDAFKTYVRKGDRGIAGTNHYKALQEGIDTEGGFVVPQDVLDRVISKEPTPTRVAAKVTQLQTSRDTLTIPRVNYTTDDLNLGVAA
jgi:HK97 family phage major capsid protein